MKIGDYNIPQNRLRDLIEDTKKFYDKFPNEEVKSELIAHTISYSPTGGAFKQRLADLRLYGLIEGRGKIKVSELGKMITYGDEKEKTDASEKIIRNIPLWNIFFDKYKASIKEENFWIDLVKITGVERPTAQTKADSIRKAYMDDIKYFKPVEKTSEISNSVPQVSETFNRSEKNMLDPQRETTQGVESNNIEEIKFSNIRIYIPKGDAKAIAIAKKLLDLYEEGITTETPIPSPIAD